MLKIAYLFIFVIFGFEKVCAQHETYEFYRKALNLKIENKYDSALSMFYEMYNKSNNKYYSNALGNIADIELELGNIDLADSLYRMCLMDTSQDAELEKYYGALHLADIRIKNKKYKEGLFYLDAHQTYKPGVFCSTGSYERRLALNWRYSKCFDGLGELDSAINLLTPFMFRGREIISYSEKYYDSLSKYYYGLLLKKYNICELRALLKNSLDSLDYHESIDTSSSLRLPNTEGMKIICTMVFLNRKISFINVTSLWTKGIIYKSQFSREYFIANIKRSSLYKYIME